MATSITNTDFLNSNVNFQKGPVSIDLSMDDLSLLAEQYKRLSLYNYITKITTF